MDINITPEMIGLLILEEIKGLRKDLREEILTLKHQIGYQFTSPASLEKDLNIEETNKDQKEQCSSLDLENKAELFHCELDNNTTDLTHPAAVQSILYDKEENKEEGNLVLNTDVDDTTMDKNDLQICEIQNLSDSQENNKTIQLLLKNTEVKKKKRFKTQPYNKLMRKTKHSQEKSSFIKSINNFDNCESNKEILPDSQVNDQDKSSDYRVLFSVQHSDPTAIKHVIKRELSFVSSSPELRKNCAVAPNSIFPTRSHTYNAKTYSETGQQPNTACHECGKVCSTVYGLKRHMIGHSGSRPFKCQICNKRFSLKWNLKTHLRIHTGEKPYKCNVCMRAFTEHGNLKKHKKIHSSS